MKHWNLFCAALSDLYRHRARCLVVILCLAAILFPFVTGLAISEGVRFQAELSIGEGADIYVSEYRSGATGSIDSDMSEELARLRGVSRVVPRVVGRAYLVDRVVTIVGVQRESLDSLKPIVDGRPPESPGEALIGQGIARKIGVQKDFPFTLAANNRKVFKVCGVLAPSCLWGSDLLVMHYDDANEFFRTKGKATHLLIYTSSSPELVARVIKEHWSHLRPGGSANLCIGDRSSSLERLRSAYGHSSGVFAVLLIVGIVLAIQAFIVTCGLGQAELHRENQVMRAIGWKTLDLWEKVAFENLAIGLAAACLSILLSLAWMKGLNGLLLAQFFVAEVGIVPDMEIPSRLIPTHLFLSLAVALMISQLGGTVSVWRGSRILSKGLKRQWMISF